jgi:hypothetical protein
MSDEEKNIARLKAAISRNTEVVLNSPVIDVNQIGSLLQSIGDLAAVSVGAPVCVMLAVKSGDLAIAAAPAGGVH